MTKEEELFESLVLELRRGTIILSVMSQLDRPQYGYYLVELLENKGLTIDPSTLYPLLRRLEKQELLVSTWDTDSNKPRKYYELSDFGRKIYKRLCSYWIEIVSTMKNFINEGE